MVIPPADVTGAQPAVTPGLGLWGGSVAISTHHHRAANEHLVRIGREVDFHATEFVAVVDAAATGFGESVGGDELHAGFGRAHTQIWGNRCTPKQYASESRGGVRIGVEQPHQGGGYKGDQRAVIGCGGDRRGIETGMHRERRAGGVSSGDDREPGDGGEREAGQPSVRGRVDAEGVVDRDRRRGQSLRGELDEPGFTGGTGGGDHGPDRRVDRLPLGSEMTPVRVDDDRRIHCVDEVTEAGVTGVDHNHRTISIPDAADRVGRLRGSQDHRHEVRLVGSGHGSLA